MNITAIKTGNWTDPTVWDLARIPARDDTVNLGNYIVTLNTNSAVAGTIYKTGTSGTLKLNTNSAITADSINQAYGGTAILTLASTSVNATINSNISASDGVGVAAFTCNVASGYTITVNGNVEGRNQNLGIGINFSGTGTLIINGTLFANFERAVNSTSSGTLIVNGLVRGSIGWGAAYYTIALATTSSCIIHGGIHCATYYTKQNYLPISNNFFMDFGDNSHAEFGIWDESSVIRILSLPAPPPNTATLTGVAQFTDQAIATLARATRRDTGAFTGDATPNPTTGAFSLPCPNTPHDVTIFRTGYRPLTHGPVNPIPDA